MTLRFKTIYRRTISIYMKRHAPTLQLSFFAGTMGFANKTTQTATYRPSDYSNVHFEKLFCIDLQFTVSTTFFLKANKLEKDHNATKNTAHFSDVISKLYHSKMRVRKLERNHLRLSPNGSTRQSFTLGVGAK